MAVSWSIAGLVPGRVFEQKDYAVHWTVLLCQRLPFDAALLDLPLLPQKGDIKRYQLLELDILDTEAVDQECEDALRNSASCG